MACPHLSGLVHLDKSSWLVHQSSWINWTLFDRAADAL